MRYGSGLKSRGKLLLASLRHIPIFLFLFPVFFIFHNYYQHSGFIPVTDVLLLLLFYYGLSLLLYLVFFLFFRHPFKSALAVIMLLSFHYFFGAFHDMLKLYSGFLSKYSVLLPAMVLIFLSLMYLVKRNNFSGKPRIFLTLLFSVLIAYDLFQMVFVKKDLPVKDLVVDPCPDCERPDVHFIVLDGYAGQKQLETEFDYSNEEFLGKLKSLGFEISSSSFSNYSNTPFSMASMLNMEYLPLKDFEYTDSNLNYCFEAIYSNRVVGVFKKLGYDFINNSIFDIDGKPAPINKTFLISGTKLITSQTLISRFKRDVYFNILGKHFPFSPPYKNFLFSDLENNNTVIDKLEKFPGETTVKPRFIYTHIMMPHFPYYFNEEGRLYPIEKLVSQDYQDEKLYLPYLKFTNNKILGLIETILRNSKKPPVIMMMSDHGFRKDNFSPGLSYMNLNAMLLPNRGIKDFPDTISGVNQFSFLFNTLFRQNFKLWEDRVVK